MVRKLIQCLSFAGICLLSIVRLQAQDINSKSILWQYGGRHYSIRFSYSKAQYRYLQNKGKKWNLGVGWNYPRYVWESMEDTTVISVGNQLADLAMGVGLNHKEIPQFVASMVQSLTYIWDDKWTPPSKNTNGFQWIRYGLETLVDHGGDCEDTSILLASLLQNMGFRCIFFNPPGHLALGVFTTEDQPNTVLFSGERYYYLESNARYAIGTHPLRYNYQTWTPIAIDRKHFDTYVRNPPGKLLSYRELTLKEHFSECDCERIRELVIRTYQTENEIIQDTLVKSVSYPINIK